MAEAVEEELVLEGVHLSCLQRDNDDRDVRICGATARRVGTRHLSDKSTCVSLCFLLLEPLPAAQKYALQITQDAFFPGEPARSVGDKLLSSVLFAGRSLPGFKFKLLCALHLVGCHKAIRYIPFL